VDTRIILNRGSTDLFSSLYFVEAPITIMHKTIPFAIRNRRRIVLI
jgi:hypothetical protein